MGGFSAAVFRRMDRTVVRVAVIKRFRQIHTGASEVPGESTHKSGFIRMIATGLETLQFDNRFTQLLPGDPQAENFRRQVRGACYSRVRPTPVAAPRLLAWSHDMAGRLGLDFDPFQTTEAAEIFGGNRLLKGMDPFARCYGGHQFGNWAGQLGDGGPPAT